MTMTDTRAIHDAPTTPELCLAAVRQNALALEFVPEALKTPELCLEAVKQNGLSADEGRLHGCRAERWRGSGLRAGLLRDAGAVHGGREGGRRRFA